jgi:hypothetical protein
MFWFGLLEAFAKEHGHCRVPDGHRTDDGYQLGNWVGFQRSRKDKMALDRRQRLEALPGWSWDPRSDQWEEGFSYLKEFSVREGHCRVPDGYRTDDGYQLGKWVGKQRSRKDTMALDRQRRLETLPGWSWDLLSDQWEEGFSHLKAFSVREGHCRVPDGYRTDDGYRLGKWIGKQRSRKDKMALDRRQRLEALPGWSWDSRSDQWEEGFSHLKEFSEREGHCRVPRMFKTDDGYGLDTWVSTQRSRKDKMALDRRQRLEALPGWSWDPCRTNGKKASRI